MGEAVREDLQQDFGARSRYKGRMLSRAVGSTQVLATECSLVQGSALTASKISRDGLGHNTMCAVGWAQYAPDCKAKQLH